MKRRHRSGVDEIEMSGVFFAAAAAALALDTAEPDISTDVLSAAKVADGGCCPATGHWLWIRRCLENSLGAAHLARPIWARPIWPGPIGPTHLGPLGPPGTFGPARLGPEPIWAQARLFGPPGGMLYDAFRPRCLALPSPQSA